MRNLQVRGAFSVHGSPDGIGGAQPLQGRDPVLCFGELQTGPWTGRNSRGRYWEVLRWCSLVQLGAAAVLFLLRPLPLFFFSLVQFAAVGRARGRVGTPWSRLGST